MKFSMQTAELARALYRVQGIADRKNTMPMLAHVLLSATQPHELAVSATDTDVGLVGTYDAMVHEAGKVAVHARQLYDIIKSIPTATVEICRQDNYWLDVVAGSSRFHLVGTAPDEFPVLPDPQRHNRFTLPARALTQMIERTLFCVSTDENRHNLSGIYCETPSAGLLRLVATDGHRLALAEGQFDVPIQISGSVIVPRKGFHEFCRVLGDSDGLTSVDLSFSASSAVLQAGSVVLSTRLIEGQFPDYAQVIPKNNTKQAKIGKTALYDALRRVSLLSHGRAYGVRFTFTEGSLCLVAEDPEFGDAQETLEVDYKGDELVIGFNARYILDVLGLITEQGISFQLADDLSPGVIRPLEDTSFLAVVMPMRI